MANEVTVQCRRDISTLVVRWQRECDTESLKIAYEYLLRVAGENQLRKWLLDTRKRNEPNPELNLWLKDVMLGKVLPTLGHSVRIAYLISPSRAAKMKISESANPVQIAKWLGSFTCQSKTFMCESDAYDWLNILDI